MHRSISNWVVGAKNCKIVEREIDIVCAGEVLIDFIGEQMNAKIEETRDYHRYLGGSPTNVAMNMARLGMNVRLAATVGKDGFGTYITEKLLENRVNTELIGVDPLRPTSIIMVSKTIGTPDFIAYRKADRYIEEKQLPDEVLRKTKIFHTTAFALSKKPARQNIIAAAHRAKELGCVLSIDLNYSARIWPKSKEALETIEEFCALDPLVKISEDDVLRLYQRKLTHGQLFDYFHNTLGVNTVCLTLGSKGVTLSRKQQPPISLPAARVEQILDATGAGDAFWSGFLFGTSKNFNTERCLKIALSLAAIKLQNVGRLPQNVDLLTQLLDIN